MDQDRRKFLSLSALTRVTAAFPLAAFAAQNSAWAQSASQPSPRIKPGLPGKPEDADSGAPPAAADPKVMLEHNQHEMKQDINKLYTLVQQLKEQVDRTDSTSVLSLNLVDSAKKVENLAKQIRNLARD